MQTCNKKNAKFQGLQDFTFDLGHFYKNCVECIKQYYGTCGFVGKYLETFWKYIGDLGKFCWKLV